MSILKGQLEKKWAPLLDHQGMPKIKDEYRRAVTAIVLENQEREARKAAGMTGDLLTEAVPTMAAGTGGFGSSATATGPVAGFDPILIALVRRSMPNLIAYDVCGVQPMSGPTGLIFAMRSRYGSQSGDEALYQEANTAWSAVGQGGTHSANANPFSSSFGTSTGANTAFGESLGVANSTGGLQATNAIPQMAFSIEKVTATAVTRALKAEYSVEIAQDLKAIHNLDAESELANILSAEILAEVNREVVRSIGYAAANGAAQTAAAGTFDLDVDSNGRWSVEKFKGLFFQIEREANAIAKQTRRGRGNIIITSSDVASALVAAGVLDYTPAMQADLAVDDTGNTFAGTLMGRYKVFVDPYAPNGASAEYFVVGYKGSSPYDAGLFYCPYVPLQMYRAVDPNSFVPKIGFKTRYALVSNPFSKGTAGQSDGTIEADVNQYYRKVKVANLF